MRSVWIMNEKNLDTFNKPRGIEKLIPRGKPANQHNKADRNLQLLNKREKVMGKNL